MKKSSDSVESFLSSLTYWETINLKMNILKIDNPNISREQAFEEASLEKSLTDSLEFDLEKIIGTVMF